MQVNEMAKDQNTFTIPKSHAYMPKQVNSYVN